MRYPQIVYDDGSGPFTLEFSLPNTGKPGADDLKAVRSDSVSFSGLRQTMLSRVDSFKNLNMAYVPAADMAAWSKFVKWAMGGGEFKFFNDAEQPDFTWWTLEDTDWKPKLAAGFKFVAAFALVLRAFVTPPPNDVTSLAASGGPGTIVGESDITLTWDAAVDSPDHFEVRYTAVANAGPGAWATAAVEGEPVSNAFDLINTSIHSGTFLVKEIGADGQESMMAATVSGTWPGLPGTP